MGEYDASVLDFFVTSEVNYGFIVVGGYKKSDLCHNVVQMKCFIRI